jgi:prepilin-type processing-associated H-X9-DG protein
MSSRASGRLVQCANNLHQVGIAFGGYQETYQKAPDASTVLRGLGPYLDNQAGVYICPELGTSANSKTSGATAGTTGPAASYGVNMCVQRMMLSDSNKAIVVDANGELMEYEGSDLPTWNMTIAPRHAGHVNVLFYDGHVDGRLPDPINPYDPAQGYQICTATWRPTLGCTTGGGCGGGLLGQYYAYTDWSGTPVVRIDSTINLPFGNPIFYGVPYSAPVPGATPSCSSPLKSGTWLGQLRADKSGQYTFYLSCDNEAWLSINGSELLHRQAGGATMVQEYQSTSPVSLNAGQWVDIQVRWMEWGLGSPSHVWVKWSSDTAPSMAEIPSCNLRPPR